MYLQVTKSHRETNVSEAAKTMTFTSLSYLETHSVEMGRMNFPDLASHVLLKNPRSQYCS